MDIAPLMEGHVLLCTDAHYPSAADVPGEIAAELDEACERLREVYLREYGAFMIFEHGRTGHCVRRHPGERMCHHVHLHLLPLAADLSALVGLGQRTGWGKWSDVRALVGDLDGYVAVDSAGSGRQLFPVTHGLAPHYLRTVVAELLGQPDAADWESVSKSGRGDVVASGRARLTSAVARGLLLSGCEAG
jgi:diadenosine tetraphosphate (Ap4A) HIT family hydrolase